MAEAVEDPVEKLNNMSDEEIEERFQRSLERFEKKLKEHFSE